jgi:hypothetical protein
LLWWDVFQHRPSVLGLHDHQTSTRWEKLA